MKIRLCAKIVSKAKYKNLTGLTIKLDDARGKLSFFSIEADTAHLKGLEKGDNIVLTLEKAKE